MDTTIIDFATAQIILASLTDSEELVIYKDPLKKIIRLYNKIKKVIAQYSEDPSGIPEGSSHQSSYECWTG
uniref:Uncharacterized protein n=1 Tax=Marseillevirus LCMAC101 TaxID=2506602 RepID=A0A481YRM0_9VIRU|nr:MAG: hypothetical protein LCMAC101_04330 [Marseillevirus LCMAC101]